MCLALHYDETHQVTQVWINQYNVLYSNVPFGGKKQSGIGTRDDEPFQNVMRVLIVASFIRSRIG